MFYVNRKDLESLLKKLEFNTTHLETYYITL